MGKVAMSLGLACEKYCLCRLGVDFNLFRPDLDVSALRTQLMLSGAPVVISTRSFTQLYNIDIISFVYPYLELKATVSA